MAQWLTNPTRNHEVAGSVPALAQWAQDGQFTDTQSRFVVARGCMEGELEVSTDGQTLPSWGDGSVLELDWSNGCTLLCIYF